MSARFFAVAMVMAVAGVQTAHGQASSDVPAETPPESYTGAQYVDSEGCMFIRAGFGEQTVWVPRVNRDRERICGQEPTFPDAGAPQPASETAETQEMVDQEPETTAAQREAPRDPAGRQPDRSSAQAQSRADAAEGSAPSGSSPRREAERTGPRVVAVADEAPARNDLCPEHAPYGQRVKLSDGRRAIRCTAQTPDSDARPRPTRQEDAPPRIAAVAAEPAARHDACPPRAPFGQRVKLSDGRKAIRCTADGPAPADAKPAQRRIADACAIGGPGVRCAPQDWHPGDAARADNARSTRPAPARNVRVVRVPRHSMPEGFESAWDDGRLNPRRAEGSSDGRAQMRRVWTDTVPRRLADEGDARRRAALSQPYDAAQQNRAAPEAATSAGGFVQVGTYGVPRNAARTAARLRDMGYPVQTRAMGSGGRRLEVVLAGPFRDRSASREALRRVRRAGYADAFTR